MCTEIMATMPSLSKFDPDSNTCTGNVYESFCDFIDEFQYEYDAVAKEPPKETCKTEEEKAAWVQIQEKNVPREVLLKRSTKSV